jgi:hypothetical protein
LQSLQAQRRRATAAGGDCHHGSECFPGFFTFAQYSTAAAVKDVDDNVVCSGNGGERRPATRAGVADVEVAVSEGGHATVKVLASRQRRMLLELLQFSGCSAAASPRSTSTPPPRSTRWSCTPSV